jgi:hypothetical protein
VCFELNREGAKLFIGAMIVVDIEIEFGTLGDLSRLTRGLGHLVAG